MQAVGVADGTVSQIFGGHGNAVPGVFEDRDVDDAGQGLGEQLAKVGVLAVEDMLVEIGQVLGALHIRPVEHLLVELVCGNMGAIRLLPGAVVALPAFGRLLIHGLKPQTADVRVALRGETGLMQHVVEAVPDDDLLAREAAAGQPGHHAVHHFQMGGDDAGSHGVDLDADDVRG